MEQQALKLESEGFAKLKQEYIKHYTKFVQNPERIYWRYWRLGRRRQQRIKTIEKLSFKLDKIWDKFKIDF